MEYINHAINWLQWLIGIGAPIRIGFIFFSAMMDGGEYQHYRKRIRNTVIFWIFALGAIVIRNIIEGYF